MRRIKGPLHTINLKPDRDGFIYSSKDPHEWREFMMRLQEEGLYPFNKKPAYVQRIR